MNVSVLSGASRNEGGLFYSVRWLSQALRLAGINIRLVSHLDEYTHADLPVWNPVKIDLYRGYGPLLYSDKLRRILRSSDTDVVHVHGIWLDRQLAALQWQKRTGKPVIISPRGMLDSWAVRNSAWKKKLVGALFANKSLNKATCIHALCQSEAESIRAYGLKNPIAVIPNGVELPEIRGQRPEAGGQKKKLLFLGRIHPKKGLAELLRAWSMEHGAWRRNWELVIAGWDDGGHEKGLKDLADELGIGDSVAFPGSKYGEEKEILLRNADAFILPSFSEGLPMSVLEAWSYGLPVVMTDLCNIPSGFNAGAALRIEPNAKSITQGLAQLDSMSMDDLTSMGAKGRILVEQKFTWDKIAQDMKAVYEWCLGGDKPACILEELNLD